MTTLALYSNKGGVGLPSETGYVSGVVVKGKCQGLMFSDFVSLTPFKQLE